MPGRRTLLPAVILVAATAFSLGLFHAILTGEQSNFRRLFSEQTKRRALAIEQTFRGRRAMVPALGALFHNLPVDRRTPQTVFNEYTSVVASTTPVMNVGHAVIVRGAAERRKFEATIGGPITHLGREKLPAPERPVYFPLLDSMDPRWVGLDMRQPPTMQAAFEKAYSEGGVHDSRIWTPAFNRFVSTSVTVIYNRSLGRPPGVANGAEHRREVKGFAYLIHFAPNLTETLGRFESLPARVQMWVDSSQLDYAPIYPETLIAQAEVPMRLVFTPTKQAVNDAVWKYTSVVGLPLAVFLVGVISAAFMWYIERQFGLVERLRKEAEEALMSRTKFLSYLCHELRNPLNATKGFIEWLRETPLSAEQAEYVDGLDTGFQHMLRIANDTLDLGKLEAGKAQIERAKFNVCVVLGEALTLHKPEADVKGVSLRLKASAGVPCVIYGDPVRLRQVITNLLSNAIKVTTRGTVVVCVCLSRLDDGRVPPVCRDPCPLPEAAARVEHGSLTPWPPSVTEDGKRLCPAILGISVIDQGPGIPPELLPALFVAYSQPVLNVGSAAGSGTGLGLCFVKALVRCWGGDISVRSLVGQGSSFLVRLPIWIEEEQGAGQLAERDTLLHYLRALRNTPYDHLRTLVHFPADKQAVRVAAPDAVIDSGRHARSEARSSVVVVTAGSSSGAAAEVRHGVSASEGPAAVDVELQACCPGCQKPPVQAASVATAEGKANGYNLPSSPARGVSPPAPQRNGALSVSLGHNATVISPTGQGTSGVGKRSYTILAVDDSELNLKIVRRKLAKLGYSVLTATNGREAVGIVTAQSGNIDLILMDLQMPVMNGHEATKELRRQGCQLPIVALTGSVTDEERRLCEQSGMSDFLAKPLQEEELHRVLKRFLPGGPPAAAV